MKFSELNLKLLASPPSQVVGEHLEALVHEEHQRPVQLEEQFDILWGQ